MKRPDFNDIKDFEEFNKYYWYRDELRDICKQQEIEYIGNKKELLHYIKSFYDGVIIKHKVKVSVKKSKAEISLDKKLLEFGFSFRNEYREFFGKQTGVKNFKYTADMAASLKKVRETKDKDFTVKDLIDVYLGKSEYAKYDYSSCQWNKFYSDFCKDEVSRKYDNKMKIASILWKKIRNSDLPKKYSREIYNHFKEELTE